MIGLNSGLLGVRRVPSGGSASGVWVPNEQSLAKRASIWPTSGDEYWSNVRLLLSYEGTNGSTTFTDSSTDARAITANGDAQISTSQFKFGASSGLLDGSGDYLSFSSISIGSSQDFTLEAFIRPASNSDLGIFYSPSSGNVQVLSLVSGKLECYINVSGGEVLYMTGATTVTTNTWHHVALTRSGSTAAIYLDGARDTAAGTHTNAFSISAVGRAQYRGDFNGYIDDTRITVGTARYTGSSYTVPVAPFPAG